MSAPPATTWLSVAQCAEVSGFSTRTIRKRIADGVLPAYKPRGSRLLRIDAADLDAMIKAGGRIAAAHLGPGRPARRRTTHPNGQERTA
jgi:excisionase family DNA binding protein